MDTPKYRVLIIKPSSLGDVIHAFPAVSLLKREIPEAEIDWLITPLFSDILDYHPAVNNKIAFNRKELGKISSFPKALSGLLKEIRSHKYDLVIDMQGLIRSAFLPGQPGLKKSQGLQLLENLWLNSFTTQK